MSITQYRGQASILTGRIVKITSTRHHTPFAKGDLVKIVGNRYGGFVRIQFHESSANTIVNKDRMHDIPLSALTLIDRKEGDLPLPEKKPRMTAKKLAELKITQGATMYVEQACITMSYDFASITPDCMKALIDLYNQPIVTATGTAKNKAGVNKALFSYFGALPPKEKLSPLDPKFDVLNGALVKQTDDREDEIEKIKSTINSKHNSIRSYENTIVSLKRNIESYDSRIKQEKISIASNEANILNTKTTIATLDEMIEVIKNKPKGDMKIAHHDKIQASLESIKRSIANLVNNSGFYNLESFSVPENGKLHLLKIVLRTNDIWLSEANNLTAPKINMGSFLIFWKPFAWLEYRTKIPNEFDNDNDEYDDNDESDDSYDSEAGSYRDFKRSLEGNITVQPYKNNIDVSGGYHPHVSGGGVCWGNALDQVQNALLIDSNYKFVNKPENAFIVLRELLKTYNSASPYTALHLFRRKQNPGYMKTLDQVHMHKGTSIISLDTSKFNRWKGTTLDVSKINPNSITRYLDSNARAVSPEKKELHAYIDVKTYAVYYMGTKTQPKEQKGKNYFKLLDNTFVECSFKSPASNNTNTITLGY